MTSSRTEWWAPSRTGWWIAALFIVGTVLFNISTFDALRQALSATEENRRVWTPDALGSIAFFAASGLAFADVRRPWLSWRPRDLVGRSRSSTWWDRSHSESRPSLRMSCRPPVTFATCNG